MPTTAKICSTRVMASHQANIYYTSFLCATRASFLVVFPGRSFVRLLLLPAEPTAFESCGGQP